MAKAKTPDGSIISGSYAGQNIYAVKNGLYILNYLLPIQNDDQLFVYIINHPSSAQIRTDTVSSLNITFEEETKMDVGAVADANYWFGGKAAYFLNEAMKGKIYTVEIVFKDGQRSLAKVSDKILNLIQGIKFQLGDSSTSDAIASEPNKRDININPNNIDPTITRIELFLEDEKWEEALAYANAALDYFPTDYRLYLYLLLGELKVTSVDELGKCSTSFTDNKNYKKVKRFATPEVIEKLEALSAVAEKNEKDIEEKQSEEKRAVIKAKELAGQKYKKEMEQLMLGEYKVPGPFNPPWVAVPDHITHKKIDYYYKDMLSFRVAKTPKSATSGAGIIHFFMKASKSKLQVLFFSYNDISRINTLSTYINNMIDESN